MSLGPSPLAETTKFVIAKCSECGKEKLLPKDTGICGACVLYKPGVLEKLIAIGISATFRAAK